MAQTDASTESIDRSIALPIVEESVEIVKHRVETGRLRVQTFVDEDQIMLRDQLERELVDVERVAIGREVSVAPLMREDGDYLIVPIMEERVVVEKRLFLVEELRIRRTKITVPVEVPTTRRVMRAVVERDDVGAQSNAGHDQTGKA